MKKTMYSLLKSQLLGHEPRLSVLYLCRDYLDDAHSHPPPPHIGLFAIEIYWRKKRHRILSAEAGRHVNVRTCITRPIPWDASGPHQLTRKIHPNYTTSSPVVCNYSHALTRTLRLSISAIYPHGETNHEICG